MPRPPRKPDLNAIVRDSMLDAAISVFSEKGYSGATMNDIAAAAGYTAPAFYKYFKGKQELFEALLDRMNSDLGSAVLEPPKGLSFESGVEEFFRRVFEMIERHTATYAVAVSIQLNPRALPSPRVAKLYHEAERRRRDRQSAWFAVAAGSERIGNIASKDMVSFFGGIVQSFYLQWVAEADGRVATAGGLVARVPHALHLFFHGVSNTTVERVRNETGSVRRKKR